MPESTLAVTQRDLPATPQSPKRLPLPRLDRPLPLGAEPPAALRDPSRAALLHPKIQPCHLPSRYQHHAHGTNHARTMARAHIDDHTHPSTQPPTILPPMGPIQSRSRTSRTYRLRGEPHWQGRKLSAAETGAARAEFGEWVYGDDHSDDLYEL